VRDGTVDPDFPEVQLGGWTGTVREFDFESEPALVLIEWDAATQERMDPHYRERCEKEGLELETMWLGVFDVEPTGATARQLVPFEQEENNHERRILTALGYAGDPGPLPPVNQENLRQYHRYLRTRLTFPCSGRYYEDPINFPDKPMPMSFKALAPEDQCVGEFGLLLEANLGAASGSLMVPLIKVDLEGDEATKQLVQDYTRWFLTNNSPESHDEGLPTLPDARRLIWRSLRNVGLAGAVCGALSGAVLATLEGGQFAVMVAAIVCGVLGYLLGTRYGQITGAINGFAYGGALGGVFGLLAGGMLGIFIGAVVLAWFGSLPGSIGGNLVGRGLAALGWKPLSRLGWTFFGAVVGGLVLAFVTDQDRALQGLGVGVLAGAALAALLLGGMIGAILAVSGRRG
jgi:hypothetical protein